MKNTRYNSTKLSLPGIYAEPCRSKGRLGRFLLTLCLMMASVGAGAADYVLTYTNGGTTYYLARNGTTGVTRVNTFNPTTCIWSCETSAGAAGTLNNNTTYGWLYQTVNGTKYYLKHGGTLGLSNTKSTTTGNTARNTQWFRTNGTYVYNAYQTARNTFTKYYINLANNTPGSNTNANTTGNARPYQVTTNSVAQNNNGIIAPTISCSGLSGSAGIQLSRTGVGGSYIPTHTTYAFNNQIIYYYNNTAYTNTNQFAVSVNANDATYNWSVTAGTANVSTTGVVTLGNNNTQNVTVRCRATINGVNKDATYTLNATAAAALNETSYSDITITPSSQTLDLGETVTYAVSASISQITKTRPLYVTITDAEGHTHYKVGTTYQAAEPAITETPGAAINFTSFNWSAAEGGAYFTLDPYYSASSNKVTLTRSAQKTGTQQTFTISVTGVYGSQNKTASATVTIPATPVDLTALHAGEALNLGIGETGTLDGHYTWEPDYDAAGAAYKKFTYTSANTSVATVDENGMVTAVGYGTTTITMQSIKIDGSTNTGVSCDITVNVMMPKLPTPTIKIRGNEVSFECDEPGVTFRYTTNGTDPTATAGTVWNGTAIINIATGSTIKVIATKSGFAPSEVASTTLGEAHVVYLRLAGAQGNRSGSSAANAVGTWADAFAKLGYGPNAAYLRSQWTAHGDANTKGLANNAVFNNATYTSTVDNNIIYLVGDVTEAQFGELMKKTPAHPTSEYNLMNPVVSSGYFKPVTISGKYANSNSNTEKYARIYINHEQKYYLNEDMRFEYVEFYGDYTSGSTDFMLCYYDLEMGDGIIMNHFYSTKNFTQYHHGYAQGVTNTAHILFYGGHTNDARFGNTAANALDGYDYYLPHPSGYKITIRSGYFSTISPGGTQWNQYNDINGAMGSPKTPVKCTITVDIDRAWNTAHQLRVLGNGSTPDCDVAVVIAGTHEGTIFGDVDINIKSGRIDRVVNGTFGANYFVGGYPADSYFGRANILVDPREPSSAEASICRNKNEMVVIRELYGGGLGRFKSDSNKDNQSSTYFYGKSSVTINGGTFSSAIYASGAGGVNGVGDANHHTPDARLPYLNGTTLAYGSWNNYNANNKLGITCHVGRPDINKPDFHENDTQIEETVYLSDTQANIAIHGGVFGNQSNPIEGIFGGGYGFVDTELINYTNNCKPNTRAGAIFAAAGQTASTVTIDGDAEIYGNIYGAGRGDNKYRVANINYNGDNYTQLGQVAGNVALSIGGNATIHGSVYGAGKGIEGFENMARLYGNTTLTIGENAVITGTVYGGGQNGTVDKNNGQYGNTQVNIEGGQVTQDVYGGGALANVSGNTKVNLTAGKVDGDVYGGGLGRTTGTPIAALVNGNATTTLDGTIIGGSIFGANNVNGTPQGHVKVDVKATTPREGQTDGQYDVAAVYGGGNQADYVPTNNNEYAEVLIENCDNSIEYVYGGGNAAAVPQAKVTINGGTFNYVFAGGNGAGTGNPGADVGYKKHTNTEYGTGTATAIVHGGVINHLFAGSNERGRIRVSQSVSVDHESACNEDILEVYGGGNLADSNAGSVTIGCGAQVGDVYGGANQANITSDILLNITGGTINRVFGGNNTSGNVSGSITVNVNKSNDCDLDLNYVYGGGNQAAYTPTTPGAYPVVNILNGTVKKDVFGGGLGATAVVTSNPQVTVNGGNITGNVFGGGSQANTDGNTTINIKNGSVGDAVYGGGALANTGNTTVNLLGGTVHDVYGGGLGQLADAEQGLSAVAATVGTATVNVGRLAYGDTPASGSVITGNVFGCNNLNGTPTGNATVNVYKTVAQPGAAAGAYHVAAVYGGGNKAAYIPADASLTSTNTTKVEVFACDNSIQYVYGGGNAASTPATNVIINGGKFDYVFGGGNGKTEPGQPENPGANVGYYQDTDINNPKSHGAEYGSGMATTEIHDGVINHIFGGSNTRGNIRYAAITQLEHIGCDFYIGEVYAAGNEAYMDGRADLNIGCIPGLGVVYGGARKADIPNDVEININSGTYGQVFGGNNESGSINGTITINIEETGCNPVIIGEVYGGGYNAPYPGNIPSGVTPRPTGITINAYSFTQIGTIYGGGYGETAVVTGDPTVNVNQVKGTHAGTTPNGGTPIPDELGVIGTVFGGGNAAKVIGNTNVNIATSDKYTVISGDNKGNEKAIEGANIQSVTVVIPEAITSSEEKTYSGVGNVYGGGNQADVTGKTNVTIGRGQ